MTFAVLFGHALPLNPRRYWFDADAVPLILGCNAHGRPSKSRVVACIDSIPLHLNQYKFSGAQFQHASAAIARCAPSHKALSQPYLDHGLPRYTQLAGFAIEGVNQSGWEIYIYAFLRLQNMSGFGQIQRSGEINALVKTFFDISGFHTAPPLPYINGSPHVLRAWSLASRPLHPASRECRP